MHAMTNVQNEKKKVIINLGGFHTHSTSYIILVLLALE